LTRPSSMSAAGLHQDRQGRVASDTRDILRQLLKRHAPDVRRRIGRKIPRRWRSVLSVDDVMQQTYTDTYLSMERSVPLEERSFSAWLWKVAQYNLFSALRMLEAEKRGEGHCRLRPEDAEDSYVALCELLDAGATTPSRHAARNEARTALENALQRLPEPYRRVVQLFDLEERPMQEVAQTLNRSLGAAYMIRARAHHCLRTIMGGPSQYFSTP
jgi:RNA polymerase sigma factor (sigma-70 family)